MVHFNKANASEESALRQIASFAISVCDKPDFKGTISKREIKGELEASSKLAKLLGVSIGANGEIDDLYVDYTNLLLEDLPEQLESARSCRKSIAERFLSEEFIYLYTHKKKAQSSVKDWQMLRTVNLESDWSNEPIAENFCEGKIDEYLTNHDIKGVRHVAMIGGMKEKIEKISDKIRFKASCSFNIKWNPIY